MGKKNTPSKCQEIITFFRFVNLLIIWRWSYDPLHGIVLIVIFFFSIIKKIKIAYERFCIRLFFCKLQRYIYIWNFFFFYITTLMKTKKKHKKEHLKKHRQL